MFALVVRFLLLDDHEEAFDNLVEETLAAIATQEPGTLIYVSHGRRQSASERVFYELYQDQKAFEAHEATEHVKRFLSERDSHLRAEPEVWWLTPLAGQSKVKGRLKDVQGS